MSGVKNDTTLGYTIERECKLMRAINDAIDVLDRVSDYDNARTAIAIIRAIEILSKAKQ